MLRLAANLDFLFTELPLLDRFDAAHQCGFEAVEILFPYDVEPEVLRRAADDAGVVITMLNAPVGDWQRGERGLATLARRGIAFDAGIEEAARYARICGAGYVHVMAGIGDPGDPATTARYLRRMRRAARRLARTSVMPLIEPINTVDMPGYFLRSFDQARALIDELASEGVGLQFDVYHCQRIHGDVLTRLEDLFSSVRHIQVAGVPHRNEPGTELPLEAVFALLQRRGYPGRIGCEYKPRGTTREGLSWIKNHPSLRR